MEASVIGMRLSAVRRKIGLTQSALGRFVGLSGVDIEKIERGIIQPPNFARGQLIMLIQMYESLENKDKITLHNYSFFFSKYDLLLGIKITSKKEFIGNKNPRICRYCNKGEGEVTFKNIAHSIPNLIGNNNLFSYDECDVCNSKFSKLETSLGDYTHLERTMSQTLGKNGVPKYKRNGDICISKSNNDFMKIYSRIDSKSLEIDEENKKLIVNSKTSYFPRDVFKILTKMALAVLPISEFEFFKDTASWILGEKPDIDSKIHENQLIAYCSFTAGPKPYGDHVSYALFKRKKSIDNIPYITFFIAFSNITFQIPVLFSTQDIFLGRQSIDLPIFSGLYPEGTPFGKTQFYPKDFSSQERQPIARSITLSYQNGEKTRLTPEEIDKLNLKK